MTQPEPPPVAGQSYVPANTVSSGRFYGWRVLAVLWLTFLNFSLFIYGGSILNAYMAKSLQMPRDSFGGGVSIAYMLMGLTAPLTAVAIHRIGSRLTLFYGTLLLALSALVLGTIVKDALGFILGFGVMAGTGLSVGGLLPNQSILADWFVRRRALATALLLSAGGVGGLIASYLFNYLIEKMGFDWQHVWLFLAGFTIFLAVLVFFLVHDHPDRVGQQPDGLISARSSASFSKKSHSKPVYQTTDTWTLKEVLQKPAVWLLLFGSLGMATSFEFCAAYGVIHLMDTGYSDLIASSSVGVLAFFAIVGRLLTGYLGDRIELRWLIAAGSAMIAAGCLLVISPANQSWITVYALMAGLGQGLVFVSVFSIMPNYFGAKLVSSIFAIALPFSSVITAGLIYLGGVIRSEYGSYSPGFIVSAVIALIAVATSIAAKPPHKAESR